MRNLLASLTATAALLALPHAVFSQQAEPPKPKPAAAKKLEKKERKATKWDAMEVGPFFSSGLAGKHQTLKALTIKVATNATVCFDTELLRMSAGWTGGFLLLPTGRDGLEGVPQPVGVTAFANPPGPGWAKDGSFTDPRPAAKAYPKGGPVGPMPRDWAHWRGLYLHGDQTILSYTVGPSGVLELPGYDAARGCFTRTFEIEPNSVPMALLVCENTGATASLNDKIALLTENQTNVTAVALAGVGKGSLAAANGRVVLNLPASTTARTFQVAIWTGARTDLGQATAALQARVRLPNLAALIQGGPARWGAPLATQGKLGRDDGPYVVDAITQPDDNPWHSWIRTSGFDFFADGTTAAVCSVSGDVWIVSGLDDTLQNLKWKRFATGLFQPLGLKVVDGKVYVTGRDQITRLHDLNGDGEADFYENFNNDICITPHYHEFALNLETDSHGNFYFTKGGNLDAARTPHHGTLLKVSKDGSKLEVVATGLRAPNGLGIGPHDEITTADNEGNWVPSSRVDLCKPGGFYGHVMNSHTDVKPADYDKPIVWLPHTYELDNSSGGQVWVTSDKWGPFAGQLLHTSYGACALYAVMQETVDGQVQGGAVKFPLKFDSGIMRGRFNQRDGQLYLAGLVVWQSKGPRQGAFHRVRYTGKPVHMPGAMQVKKNGLQITFTTALDSAAATDPQNYKVDQWNYRWTSNYGSKDYSVIDPQKQGRDKVEVKSVQLLPDGKTIFIETDDLKPVMQMRVKYNLKSADGAPVISEIHNTINKVPAS